MRIKRLIFKTCPKSGRIRGFRTDTVFHKLLYPLIGLAALIWVLIRVAPKPSRASYPCQQAAIPLAGSFVAWFLATSGFVFLFKKARKYFADKRVLLAYSFTLVALVLFIVSQLVNNQSVLANNNTILPDNSNKPIGIAKGIYPGRVTWIRDTTATPWDGQTGNWWFEGNINESALAKMYSRSLQSLTGATSDAKAWRALFKYYNRTHGRGNRGWRAGELVAVKININNTYTTNDVDNEIDQSPQATRQLLLQLTGPAGVAQKDIIVYDATVGFKARAIPDRIYKPLHEEFPGVRWMDGQGSPGREKPEWVANAISYTSPDVELGDELPKAVIEAAYLVNIALLKGHEIAGVTLCAKNHFGSIRHPVKDHKKKYLKQMSGDRGDCSAFVDLMGSPNLGGKTLLYIVDGLYGMQTNVGAPQARDRWQRLFNGQWSASYFMSQDPVAIESVCLDFLLSEFQGELGYSGSKFFQKGSSRNCDNYLIQAALAVNDKYGPYRPNGIKINSLGVYEHWNNWVDKKYSRNLKTGKGIELFCVPLN